MAQEADGSSRVLELFLHIVAAVMSIIQALVGVACNRISMDLTPESSEFEFSTAEASANYVGQSSHTAPMPSTFSSSTPHPMSASQREFAAAGPSSRSEFHVPSALSTAQASAPRPYRQAPPFFVSVKYYVVRFGHPPGFYSTWEECEQAVKGVSGAKFKSFKTWAEAVRYWQEGK